MLLSSDRSLRNSHDMLPFLALNVCCALIASSRITLRRLSSDSSKHANHEDPSAHEPKPMMLGPEAILLWIGEVQWLKKAAERLRFGAVPATEVTFISSHQSILRHSLVTPWCILWHLLVTPWCILPHRGTPCYALVHPGTVDMLTPLPPPTKTYSPLDQPWPRPKAPLISPGQGL